MHIREEPHVQEANAHERRRAAFSLSLLTSKALESIEESCSPEQLSSPTPSLYHSSSPVLPHRPLLSWTQQSQRHIGAAEFTAIEHLPTPYTSNITRWSIKIDPTNLSLHVHKSQCQNCELAGPAYERSPWEYNASTEELAKQPTKKMIKKQIIN
jgi:hypothetical protein